MKSGLKLFFILIIALLSNYSIGQSIGGSVSGSTAFCTSQNSGFVSLSNYQGNILFWQYSDNNGVSWNMINNTQPTQSYNSVSVTTLFRAIVKDNIFPIDTSSSAQITILPAAKAGTIIGTGTFCAVSNVDTIKVIGTIGNIEKWEYSINNGGVWNSLSTNLALITYSNLVTTTKFRVIASNIQGCPFDTSQIATLKIDEQTISGVILGKDSVCLNESNISLNLSGAIGDIVEWKKMKISDGIWQSTLHNGDSLQLDSIKDSFAFTVFVKNGSCPTLSTNIFVLNVMPVNLANAGTDKTITQRESVRLNGSGNGNPYWIKDQNIIFSNRFDALVYPEITSTYTLMLLDKFGCITYDDVKINVIIPIPNAISPNNDGINDYFMIDKIEEFPNSNLKIFNKWGKLVYNETPYNNAFNGKSSAGEELPEEVYYFVLNKGNGEEIKNYLMIKR